MVYKRSMALVAKESSLVRTITAIDGHLERHFWRWASAIAGLLLLCSIAKDVHLKLWIDELYTLYIVRQGSASEMIKAILEGCDGQPPAYDLMVRPLFGVLGSEALALRLPSTIGFTAMLVCLLVFCRRRLPAIYALLAALLVGDSCLLFASEGRSYGMVLGCAGGALLAWQNAMEGRQRGLSLTLMSLCLSLMVSLHYFSIFFLGPFLVIELFRAVTSRRIDYGMLVSLSAPLAVLALHYPLIQASGQFQAHFWARASLGGIPQFYRLTSFHILHITAAAFIVVAVLAGSAIKPIRPGSGLSRLEWAILTVLALLPPVVIVAAMFTVHSFTESYLIWVVIGFGVLVAALLRRAARGCPAVGAVILVLVAGSIFRQEIGGLIQRPDPESESIHRALTGLGEGSEPIAIASPRRFMELAYYEEPRIRRRLVYPASRELDVRYLGFDTDTIILLALRPRSSLAVWDCDTFLAAHPRFLLGVTPNDYLARHLVSLGYRLTRISLSEDPLVFYRVERVPL